MVTHEQLVYGIPINILNVQNGLETLIWFAQAGNSTIGRVRLATHQIHDVHANISVALRRLQRDRETQGQKVFHAKSIGMFDNGHLFAQKILGAQSLLQPGTPLWLVRGKLTGNL